MRSPDADMSYLAIANWLRLRYTRDGQRGTFASGPLPQGRPADKAKIKTTLGWGSAVAGSGLIVGFAAVQYQQDDPTADRWFWGFLLVPIIVAVAVAAALIAREIRSGAAFKRSARLMAMPPTPSPANAWTRRLALLDRHQSDQPEISAARVAAVSSHRILTNPAWSTRYLDTHRVRLDVDEELAQIIDGAHELDTLRRRLGQRAAAADQRSWDINVQALDSLADGIAERARALNSYATAVTQINHQLRRAEQLRHELSIGDEIADLIARRAGDGVAAEHTHILAKELEDANTDLSAQLDYLRSTLTILAEPMPAARPLTA